MTLLSVRKLLQYFTHRQGTGRLGRVGCEKFVCLGDLTGYGDEAVACVELARKTFDVCLMGNHDSACCGLEHPEIVKLVRSYEKDVAAREQLSADAMKWLSERPYTFATKLFACAHSEFAAPKDWNYIELPPNAWPSLWTRKEQILFVGHTHVPVIMAMGPESVRLSRSFDEQEMLAGMRGLKALTKTSGLIKPGVRYVVNVGSVGRPREGSLPTYATLDDATQRIELVTLR